MELEARMIDESYEYRQMYVDANVVRNRAFYMLRVIAGLVPNDPKYEEDPRKVAMEWLKAHGVDKPLMPFVDEIRY